MVSCFKHSEMRETTGVPWRKALGLDLEGSEQGNTANRGSERGICWRCELTGSTTK